MADNNPLKVVSVDTEKSRSPGQERASRRNETTAKYDRLWLQNPEQFNPIRNSLGRERLNRTWNLIVAFINPQGILAADLGCGSGVFSRRLRDAGATVHAVDVSSNALKELTKGDCRDIEPKQDYVPKTLLGDGAYDLVVCTDLIALLPAQEYRLFFSELARIVSSKGYVVCSTPVDIQSDDALQNFADLAMSEFDIKGWVFSYNGLFLRKRDVLKAPERFVKGARDASYRKAALERRISIGRWWYKINSQYPLAAIWYVVSLVTRPIVRMFDNSPAILSIMEKLTKMISGNQGISHAIFIGQRRSMLQPTAEYLRPEEPKHKKQVWE